MIKFRDKRVLILEQGFCVIKINYLRPVMKKYPLLLCILSIFIFSVCKSQGYKYLYYLDADLHSVKKSKALILGKGLKENGLFRLDCFSVTDDHLYIQIHFKDSTLADLEGPYISYYQDGKPQKQGSYVNGDEEGNWKKWDSLGRIIDSAIYKQGKALIESTFGYQKNGSLSFYDIKDSLQDTYKYVSYNEKAEVDREVFFKGQKGILKDYTSTGIQTDSLFTRAESEADFPGGTTGWVSYLQKNLDADVPVRNGAPAGTYQVMIRFIVKKDGSIDDVLAETYFGYGMEKEVIRIIKNGPKWIPAVQYGRKVNAYRRQPVTFVVSEK
jgi:antitoxin component YwqK of YwqJK toxin-antitoxin module